MRLTTEQRLAALERDNVVLHDTIELLHKMLKEQRDLITEYITCEVARSNPNSGELRGGARRDQGTYIFICRHRFDRIEKHLDKVRKRIEGSRPGTKAG